MHSFEFVSIYDILSLTTQEITSTTMQIQDKTANNVITFVRNSK